MGVLPKGFLDAYKSAEEDKTVKGYLMPKALEENSLLNKMYRVHEVKGAKIKDGKLVKKEPPRPEPIQPIIDVGDDNNRDEKLPRELSIVGIDNGTAAGNRAQGGTDNNGIVVGGDGDEVSCTIHPWRCLLLQR